MATSAYVNPVFAVILGAAVVGKGLEPEEYPGMAVVVCAMALAISSPMKSGRPGAEIEASPVERES
ncbi:MAG: hypothetical protein ACLGRW_10720 [Acidobacteriota bacterium]